MHTMPTSTVFYLKFNQQRENTPLLNANIRKALAMAFDKQAYAGMWYYKTVLSANGLVPENLLWILSTGEPKRHP